MSATLATRRNVGTRCYNATVAMFLVVLRRSGPEWDAGRPMEEQTGWDALVAAGFLVLGGPLADVHRVVHVVEADSEDAVRARLAADPWSGSHLQIHSIDSWTIRLDGRKA